MAEKRRVKRFMKRLKVRFGESALSNSGLTADISATGMFVQTGQLPKVGSRLHLEVTVSDTQQLFFEGVVARQTVVPPELRSIVRAGFGVRFLSGAELLGEMVPQTKGPAQLTVTFATRELFETAWKNELQRGGVFLWSAGALASINAVLPVNFDLAFAGELLTLEAKVVHLLPDPSGRQGLALVFTREADAKAQLNRFRSNG
jgi:Tfp pilus assembly protein PilZ